MRILFFSTYYAPYLSGLTTYPQQLFPKLAKDHQITVLTFRHQDSLPTNEMIAGVQVIRMPYLFRLSKGFISLRSVSYFLTHARDADIILLNIPNFEGFPLAFIARLLSKKVISIFHCRVSSSGGIFNRLAALALDLSVRLQLTLSHQVVAYTQDYAQAFLDQSLQRKAKYILPPIPSYQPDQSYLKKLRDKKADTFWIGFAGRISKEKGVEVLIDALKDYPETIELVIAGPQGKEVVGEERYFRSIHKQLNQANISYRFLGVLKDAKLAAFYRALDVLVLPSIYSTEAFGMVQIEAMRQGTPVIATNLPGVRIPIKKTSMGLVIPSNDPLALRKALKKIVSHPERFTISKDINLQKFCDPDTTVVQYQALLKESSGA